MAATPPESTPILASLALALINSSAPSSTLGSTLDLLMPWKREKTSRRKAKGYSHRESEAKAMPRATPTRLKALSAIPVR